MAQQQQPKYPPPPYESVFGPTNAFPAPGQQRLPADYVNVSTVPATSAMSWSEVVTRPPGPSSVPSQREQNGNVASYDARLNNPEELWKFIVGHSTELPGFELEIEGFDSETNYAPRDYRDNEVHVADLGIGDTKTPRFWITMDLTPYLAAAPSRIVDVQGRPINLALQDYCSSTSELKELVVTKQIWWDFEELKHAVYGIVRQAGWDGLVDIRINFSKNKVYARSDTPASHAKNDPITQCCMIVTCCWICAGTAANAATKKVSTLVVEYPAIAPVREFYDKNFYVIADGVKNRVTQRVRAWN